MMTNLQSAVATETARQRAVRRSFASLKAVVDQMRADVAAAEEREHEIARWEADGGR